MTMAAKKIENRKRKMSDVDVESEEETTTVAKDSGTSAKVSKKSTKPAPVSESIPSTDTDDGRRDERDRRTLFLKNLPGNCTVRHIKALSKDMKQVRLRSTFSMIEGKRKRISYAYVSFASEEAAEKNFKLLDGTVFKGTKISVDYVGSKSHFKSENPKKEPVNIDPLRLYLSGLSGNTTEEDIKKLFPEAVDVNLPRRNKDKVLFGYGFVSFTDADVAKKYHEEGQDLSLNGKKLVVLYAKKMKGGRNSEPPKQKQKGTKAAPKLVVVNADDDDEDEEDDDDDDEEDDDDEDDDDDDE